jgi:hypothetical protein
MRQLFALLPLLPWLLSPLAASAQSESVTVEMRAMEGVWKISYPTGPESFSIWHGPAWRPAEDHFCRIERDGADLSAYCLGSGIGGEGSVTIKDAHIHLAFGTFLARSVINATLQSNVRFTGSYTLKLAGVDHDAKDPSIGTKQILVEGAPDASGKAGLVKTLLEQSAVGAVSVPHDVREISRNLGELMTPEDFEGLGTILVVNYLGLSPKFHIGPDGKSFLGKFPIYGVEFEHGERICALNLRADGVMDYFHCV